MRFLILFLALFLPLGASAATLTVTAEPLMVGVSDVVQVQVQVDATLPVNAFSGTLTYPSSLLELVGIIDGNSIVNLWVTHPSVAREGAIPFAGITPGGFSGSHARLFAVLFKVRSAGTPLVTVEAPVVLLNDGSGTSDSVTLTPLRLFAKAHSQGGYVELEDSIPPEPFTVYVSSDAQVSGGQSYSVFMAVDKASGVDHYMVAESRWPAFLLPFFPLEWATTTAPYVLVDQDRTSTLYVKAVDRMHNERLATVVRLHVLKAHEQLILLCILILGILSYAWRRGKRKNYDALSSH